MGVVTRLRGIIVGQWGSEAVEQWGSALSLSGGRNRSAHGLADCCKFRVRRLWRCLVRRPIRAKAQTSAHEKIKDAIFYLLNKANEQLKCCSKVQEGPQEAVE